MSLVRLLAVAAAVSLLAACGDDDGPPAIDDLNAEGARLVERFVTTVASGDAGSVQSILAPGFQIMRANGVVYERDEYLANLPEVGDFEIMDIRATRSEGTLTVSYVLEVTVTLDGLPQTTRAPRLSTFERDGEDWLLTSHANFGAITAEDG